MGGGCLPSVPVGFVCACAAFGGLTALATHKRLVKTCAQAHQVRQRLSASGLRCLLMCLLVRLPGNGIDLPADKVARDRMARPTFGQQRTHPKKGGCRRLVSGIQIGIICLGLDFGFVPRACGHGQCVDRMGCGGCRGLGACRQCYRQAVQHEMRSFGHRRAGQHGLELSAGL